MNSRVRPFCKSRTGCTKSHFGSIKTLLLHRVLGPDGCLTPKPALGGTVYHWLGGPRGEVHEKACCNFCSSALPSFQCISCANYERQHSRISDGRERRRGSRSDRYRS